MRVKFELASLQTENHNLTRVERALNCCALAKRLEKAGEFQGAAEALREFWPNSQLPPVVDDLERAIQAEVLLRVGVLIGWIGSVQQTNGGQENAKDLITRSLEIFEAIEETSRVADARSELALCYWREGGFDEARINLSEALRGLKNGDADLRARILIRSGLVEASAARWNEALRFYEQSSPLIELSNDDALKGTYHNSVAATLTELAAAQNREDYRDQALIEYAAAGIHFEEAGNTRYCALVENNLGFLFFTIGRFNEALSHIDRARAFFSELGDKSSVAQVDDTRARTLIAAGEPVHAERFARAAVRVLEKGDEHSLLAGALITHGIALARIGKEGAALAELERAIDMAQTAGDLESAGRARLTILEELGDSLPVPDLVPMALRAIDELKNSQDASIKTKLIIVAYRLLETLHRLHFQDAQIAQVSWEGFSLKRYVHEVERVVIERALRDAAGSVTEAARLLGYKHHQSVISLINTRHKELADTRSPVHKRWRRIFSVSKTQKTSPGLAAKDPTVRILHVEDDKAVANFVRDVLSGETVQLDQVADGNAALKTLESSAEYDVLVVDNGLPGLSGLELVLRCKGMRHRKNMKIVMLSGDEIEKEAWRAGVNEFLRKPEDVDRLASIVARLLANKEKPKKGRKHSMSSV